MNYNLIMQNGIHREITFKPNLNGRTTSYIIHIRYKKGVYHYIILPKVTCTIASFNFNNLLFKSIRKNLRKLSYVSLVFVGNCK